jgi:LysM repeat protein/anti-sigma factor ChrR (cupin superfamily)
VGSDHFEHFDQCALFEHEAAAFVLGDLPGDRRAEMVAHLQACSPCRREVAGLNAALDSMSVVTRPVEPGPGFVDSVLAAAEATLAPAPATARVTRIGPPVTVVMRRRRTLLGLTGATFLLAAVAAGSASWAVSSLAIASAVLLVTYLGLVIAVTHTQAREELAATLPVDDCWWGGFEPVTVSSLPPAEELVATPVVAVDNMSLVRFVGSYFAGWMLTPVVALIALVRGDLAGVEQSPVLGRIVALQRQGRAQSLRLLAAGATSVAVAGGATMVVAPGLASAATSAPTYAVHSGDPGAANSAGQGAAVSYLAQLNGITGTYTVQAGDTLEAIADRFGTTVASLAAANHISDTDLVVVGQVLTVTPGPPRP